MGGGHADGIWKYFSTTECHQKRFQTTKLCNFKVIFRNKFVFTRCTPRYKKVWVGLCPPPHPSLNPLLCIVFQRFTDFRGSLRTVRILIYARSLYRSLTYIRPTPLSLRRGRLSSILSDTWTLMLYFIFVAGNAKTSAHLIHQSKY